MGGTTGSFKPIFSTAFATSLCLLINIKSDFEGDFQIVNQLGQTVKSFKVNMNGINTINLDNISDGVYS